MVAEERLASSRKAEADIQLIKAFGELMDIANGRSRYVLSSEVIQHLLSSNSLKEASIIEVTKFNSAIHDASMYKLPVGSARQDAAITSIYVLAKEHNVLKEVGINALEELRGVRPKIVDQYVEDLKN